MYHVVRWTADQFEACQSAAGHRQVNSLSHNSLSYSCSRGELGPEPELALGLERTKAELTVTQRSASVRGNRILMQMADNCRLCIG
jgi:hypothetical protein